MKNRGRVHSKKKGSNRRLSDSYTYTGELETKTGIRLVQYNSEMLEVKDTTDLTLFAPLVNSKYVSWIHVSGLTEASLITSMVKEFGLHNLDAKDILTPEHIVKVEVFDNHMLIILNDCFYDTNGEFHKEHLSLILTKNAVISFTESNSPLFDATLSALQNNLLGICDRKADTLLAFLLNHVTVSLVDSASRIEDMLEDLEEQLLDIKKNQLNFGEIIQGKRREYMTIKKSVLPLKEQFGKLLIINNPLINKDTLPLFRDANDQLQYVTQSMEGCREIISSLVDLYISNNDLRMNAIMKRLTVVSTIFIPLTFLAGIWGMNFKWMPELNWQYGYLIAWGLMLLSGILTWLYMKRKDWY